VAPAAAVINLPRLDPPHRACYFPAVLICKTFEQLAALDRPLHLALGVFDGVHIGHQAVIERAVRAAAAAGELAGMLTFEPHPIRVIAPEKAPKSLLATLDHKAEIVRELGIELFVPLHFDAAFAAMEASEFITQLTTASIRTLAVGEDWRFGRQRGGDVTLLRREAFARGFRLEAVPPVMIDGERVSSTRIRQAIRDGNFTAANLMLGRPYSLSGKVIEGRKLGRTLGFPTANLDTMDAQLPPDGVWIVYAHLAGRTSLQGIANLGIRPTVDGVSHLLEVHLLDFHEDLYAQTLEIQFEKFLRPEVKFESVEALKAQIQQDAQSAKAFFQI